MVMIDASCEELVQELTGLHLDEYRGVARRAAVISNKITFFCLKAK